MPTTNKSEIIRALFAAYMSNDRKAIENSFTDDFRFTTPYDDRIDKATYFERCWKASELGRTAGTGKDIRRGR